MLSEPGQVSPVGSRVVAHLHLHSIKQWSLRPTWLRSLDIEFFSSKEGEERRLAEHLRSPLDSNGSNRLFTILVLSTPCTALGSLDARISGENNPRQPPQRKVLYVAAGEFRLQLTCRPATGILRQSSLQFTLAPSEHPQESLASTQHSNLTLSAEDSSITEVQS